MVDVSLEILEKAFTRIKENLQKSVSLNKMSQEMMEQILSRLKLEVDLGKGVQEADMVIEAVPEKIELKLEILRKIDPWCEEEVIFASASALVSQDSCCRNTTNLSECISLTLYIS
jgi:3-hydroxyacyl-CoA dehydrogenase